MAAVGYVKLPGFGPWLSALADPSAREMAVRRYAAKAIDSTRQDLASQLTASASRALALFAGAELARNGKPAGGLQGISDFIESNVPEAERARASEVLVRILNGALFELAQLARAKEGLPPLETGDRTQAFMTQAVLALSDAPLYPAPMAFQLKDFTQVQASVFQVARAPGRNIVYLGCALLILGVFAMLYVRERRLWIWISAAAQGQSVGTTAMLAMSSNRKTMDADKEFEMLKIKLIGSAS